MQDFARQEIKNSSGDSVGFNVFGRDNEGNPFSGGTHRLADTALRIAIAEAFERSLFDRINDDSGLSKALLIDQFPSTSGFAAGFNSNRTRFRSFCEGLERWAWSQWIDGESYIPQVHRPDKLSPLSIHLLESFNQVLWFQKTIPVLFLNKEILLKFSVVIGLHGEGVFPGSRVSGPDDDFWEHGLIEAHRNFVNASKYSHIFKSSNDIISKRIYHFSINGKTALTQINAARSVKWKDPDIRLFREVDTKVPGVYLWRCLFSDYIGWHLGDENRFVY
jgi:hypothetical protein